jgi:hypothetical protein
MYIERSMLHIILGEYKKGSALGKIWWTITASLFCFEPFCLRPANLPPLRNIVSTFVEKAPVIAELSTFVETALLSAGSSQHLLKPSCCQHGALNIC